MRYKEQMKTAHDAKIKHKSFTVGQKVWLYNSRIKLFPGKLKSRWLGPYVVVRVGQFGDVTVEDPKDGLKHTVNGHRLKPFLDGNDKEDAQTESVSFLASVPTYEHN